MSDPVREARWLRETVGVRPLELGALRVTGEDARSWLNGQITNDVSRTQPGDAIYAVAVDVKGRILSELRALDLGDAGFDVLVPRERLAFLSEHLERYVVMEDVELVGRDLVVVTAQGPASAALDLGGFPSDRLGQGGVDLVDVSLETVVARAEQLGGGLVGEEGWELARLRARVPAWGLDFDETTYPQEAGLRATAVSFTKGCYLGQEVICMLENRGQLRRHLVALEGDALPPPGSALEREGVEVGTVRSGMVDPQAGIARFHAYVKRSAAAPETVLASAAGLVTVREIVGGGPTTDAP
ncbi:MAG: folate-binding protein YgfZ [Myxococcales bacterium]|nr:folate-binding protein YgfZ [Myxococcales bacterium]